MFLIKFNEFTRFFQIFGTLHKICVFFKVIFRNLAEMVGWYPQIDPPPLRGRPGCWVLIRRGWFCTLSWALPAGSSPSCCSSVCTSAARRRRVGKRWITCSKGIITKTLRRVKGNRRAGSSCFAKKKLGEIFLDLFKALGGWVATRSCNAVLAVRANLLSNTKNKETKQSWRKLQKNFKS